MDWITVAAAFLIAILSGMGVGSAGLLVVYLTMVLDMHASKVSINIRKT